MRGKVEVFSIEDDGSCRLLHTESNLVVDGAGETIVDMLTTPSSVLAVTPSIMDTSNWRVNAISFGTAGGNFGNNAVSSSGTCNEKLTGAPASYVTLAAINDPTSWVNPDRSVKVNRIIRALYLSGTVPGTVTASSYTPPYKLPSYPDPLDTKLEDVNMAYVNVSGDGTKSFGQFENRINFNLDDASAYTVGAFAVSWNAADGHGNGNFWTALVSSLEGDFVADRTLNLVASAEGVGSVASFNGRANVDYRGFCRVLPVNLAAIEWRGATGWDPADSNDWRGYPTVSGVGVQTNPIDFVTDPRIHFCVALHPDDCKMFNIYGGLHHIGLWTFDVKKCFADVTAPVVNHLEWPLDSAGANNREYRLFAKKTFTENLVRNKDNGSSPGIQQTNNLILKWTMDFRLIHD
jgi:hypothetical protein